MSSAIKPPGSGGPPEGPGAPPEAGAARPAEGAPEEFRAALDESRTEKAAGAVAASQQEVAAATPAPGSRAALLRSLADDLRAGRIDPQQAVDQLVDRTLSTGSAASLPPARRAELEALLRSTLEQDPTLAAMQRDLSRGR